MTAFNISISVTAYLLLFLITIHFFDRIFVNRKCKKPVFYLAATALLAMILTSTLLPYLYGNSLSFNPPTCVGAACILSLLYAPKLRIKLLYSVLLIVLAAFSMTAALYGIMILSKETFPDFMNQNKLWFFIALLCSIAIFWQLSSLMTHFAGNVGAQIPIRYILLLFTVPLISVGGMVQLYNDVPDNRNTPILFRFLLLICILYVNLTVFYLFGKLANHIQQASEIQLLQQQLKLQEKFYERLKANQSEIRKIRHDMKHRLEALHILLSDNQYKSAEAELSSFLNDVYTSKMVDSGNSHLDAILNIKFNEAMQADVKVEMNLFVAARLQLSFSDLCILLGNAFDNALEACLKVPKERRKIRLEMSHVNRALYISLTNPFSDDRLANNLETTKSEPQNHGIGLKSIRYIAEKHSGNVRTEVEHGQFHLIIVLQDSSEAP